MKDYPEKIEAISRLLQERTAVFPVRDSSYERLSLALEEFADELLADLNSGTFNPESELAAQAWSLSESPVFICGSMKSGTTLLCHLLDSHPELLVMPGDSHYLELLKRWERTQFKEIASYWVHRLVNPTGQEPFWFFGREEGTFRLFLSYLDYFLRNSDRDPFVCVVMSFFAVDSLISSRSPRKYWVEKTPHNELHARALSRMFPRAKFIHVLRNPLNNIVSLRRLDTYREWRGSALDHARVIKGLFKAAQTNLEILGENRYLIIKYEDLTRSPSEVMNRICAFLGIQFDPVLLVPTENGRPAVSNSMFRNERVKGEISDRGNASRYQTELDGGEIQDIVTTLYAEALKAGYDWGSKEILQYRKTGFSYSVHLAMEYFDAFLLKVRSVAGNR